MFIPILDYMTKSRNERKSHLKLNEPCIEIGGWSQDFRGLLAYFLGTTIPKGKIANLCHGCLNDKCSNVNHLYWGTNSDNTRDEIEGGKYISISERIRRKHGEEYLKNIVRRAGSNNKGKKHYDAEKIKLYTEIINSFDKSEWGWVNKAAKQLNVTHTTIRRFIKNYMNNSDSVTAD